MNIWCRNCNEITLHECIGIFKTNTSLEARPPAFFRLCRKMPKYACKICRCEVVIDDDGQAHAPAEFR